MATSKVTGLTELTAVASSDILYIVDDPGGSPISKKATVANVVGGGWAVVTKTDSYVATAADSTIVCNKGTAMTITLPVASGGGKWFTIKNIGAGVVTVDGNASDTIDGSATRDMAQWDAITVVDYAANAWVITNGP